ncbi:MAG TPA: Bpu10I family restriction endonuclease [Gallionella sp.]|nr:Bpu10I family restriction endonuclease [Gallionella sp.]
MTWESVLTRLNAFSLLPASHPHGSNISTKSSGTLTAAQRNALTRTIPQYLALHEIAENYESGDVSLHDLLERTERYYDLVKLPEINNCFSHQSDFVSSVLPELLCVLLRRVVSELPVNRGLIVTAQKDIAIECNFDVAAGGRIIVKRKRMDVAILSPGTLSFRDENIDFGVPAFCAEVKTNIDKNMLSGIESSVETLKQTFPRAKYYAIGEYSDFEIESQNYASTGIDEILIARQQKRSVVRRSPELRNRLSEELLESFLQEVREHLEATTQPHTDLASRLPSGRLI